MLLIIIMLESKVFAGELVNEENSALTQAILPAKTAASALTRAILPGKTARSLQANRAV